MLYLNAQVEGSVKIRDCCCRALHRGAGRASLKTDSLEIAPDDLFVLNIIVNTIKPSTTRAYPTHSVKTSPCSSTKNPPRYALFSTFRFPSNTSQLIHECIANFTLAPDKAALTRISETLSFLNEARQLRLNGLTNDLHRLERKHKALQQQHELEVQKYSPQEHAEKILEMDGKKFRVAKEASEAEIEGERLELEVERCEKSLGELKKRAAAGMNGGVAGQANVGKTAGQAVYVIWFPRCERRGNADFSATDLNSSYIDR